VGLRRLRAALSLFNDMLYSSETDRMKRELKWLTDQLGPSRDINVFISKTVVPSLKRHPERREFEVLADDLEKERHAAFANARSAVANDRFRRLLLDCALWVIDGEWLDQARPAGAPGKGICGRGADAKDPEDRQARAQAGAARREGVS
jgi:triphosphatase